jgi:hypothetical protein
MSAPPVQALTAMNRARALLRIHHEMTVQTGHCAPHPTLGPCATAVATVELSFCGAVTVRISG